MGNITNWTVNGTVETYTPDPNHPYAVDTVMSDGSTIYSASYDADGNMTSRNGYPIQWTVDNLPSSMASALGSSTFNYGPDGNRYSQTAMFNGNTTATAYIGGLFEVISTATTTEYRHNIVADGQIVAVHTITQSGSASTDYLHYDHLGSVDAITDDQGNVIQAMSFDAYGLRRDATNWNYDLSQNTLTTLKNYTDRGYTGQEQLDNLTLVDMNGRVYDPTVGRMISADPTVPDALFSQAFNRFAYVYDSPLEYTDPSGFVINIPGIVVDCDLECQIRAILQNFNMFAGNWFYYPLFPPPVLPPGVGGHVGGGGKSGSSNNTNNNSKQLKSQQPKSFCPRAQPGATPPLGAHNSSAGITNWDNSNAPANSVIVTAPNGVPFFAPDYANFQAAYMAGVNDGALSSPIAAGLALNADFGHWGQFDFQRNGSTFIHAYTNASNYAVGIGLNGAGYSLDQTINTVNQFAALMSSNGNAQRNLFVTQGWEAAQSGACQ